MYLLKSLVYKSKLLFGIETPMDYMTTNVTVLLGRLSNSQDVVRDHLFKKHGYLSMEYVGMISRREQELVTLTPNVDNSEEYQNLCSLVYKQGQYWMFHSKSLLDDSFKNHADRVWKIVKYQNYKDKNENSCRVIEGDVIKFGRVRFRIKKLVVD